MMNPRDLAGNPKDGEKKKMQASMKKETNKQNKQ